MLPGLKPRGFSRSFHASSAARFFNPALWWHPGPWAGGNLLGLINFLQNLQRHIHERICILVVTALDDAAVKPLQGGEKDAHRAGTVYRQENKFVCSISAHLTVQLLQQVIADGLTHTLRRTIPAVLPLAPPMICFQITKVGQKCLQICSCGSIRLANS
jgi:hypothetical protein